jgi:hypothetical protein
MSAHLKRKGADGLMLFRRKSNKRVSLAMAFLLLLGSFGGWPLFPLPVAKAAPMWPVATGRIMPFAPADSLVTTQNPPDFSLAGDRPREYDLSSSNQPQRRFYDHPL